MQVLALPVAQVGAKMRGKTLECISLVGVAVGPDMFREDAKNAMGLIVSQMLNAEAAPADQAVNYLHQACGRICRALKQEFVPYLPSLLPSLLRSVAAAPEMKIAGEEDSNEDFDGMETMRVHGREMEGEGRRGGGVGVEGWRGGRGSVFETIVLCLHAAARLCGCLCTCRLGRAGWDVQVLVHVQVVHVQVGTRAGEGSSDGD
jgi:hypothetical protein